MLSCMKSGVMCVDIIVDVFELILQIMCCILPQVFNNILTRIFL